MLKPLARDEAQRLREFLAESHYTAAQFRETPALRDPPNRSGNLPVLLERTREPSTLSVLLRWFFLGVPLEARAAAGLIPEAVQRLMLECGMLQADGHRLSATVLLTPWEDCVFASDPASRTRSEQSADAVVMTGGSTRMLLLFTMRIPAQVTLDLGAGCGIQGILAARHSRHVVATDVNPRAEEFTVFNASLNGVGNIECLTGDTFEPVRGRTFDRILANPPFFVTPASGRLYCESSMELDQYCRRVVREAALHLTEGGWLQALLEWANVRGQPWQEKLQEWLEGNGCDAWVLRGYARDAVGYAAERMRERFDNEVSSARFAEWMAYYRQRGVEEVHGGVLTMRRRSGKNWIRIEDMPVDPVEPVGDSVVAAFTTLGLLEACPRDEDLLRTRPRLSPQAQLQQKFRAAGGKWAGESLLLQAAAGIPVAALAVEKSVAEFLARCDGSRTLEELAEELASGLKVGAESVRQQCCAVIRRLADRRLVHLSE